MKIIPYIYELASRSELSKTTFDAKRVANIITLNPQHYKIKIILSTWAIICCSGFCHVAKFTYLSVAQKNKRTSNWHDKDSN